SRDPIGPLSLERLREQLSARDVSVVSANGQAVLSAVSRATSLLPARQSVLLLRQARGLRVLSQLEGLDDANPATPATNAGVRAIAVTPSSDLSLAASEDRFLMVTQPVPAALATNALAVQSAYREYQQRALAREGLRRMYIGTLTLALILAVFGAVLLAVT